MAETQLSPNTLSFIGLSSEYCSTLEQASQYDKEEFVAQMLKLLPRLYITISDISIPPSDEYDTDLAANFVDEQMYDTIRLRIAALLGQDDAYLETFEEDMKYSDTPIGASIAEGLSDIFQDLFNFAATVRDSDGTLTLPALAQCKENFATYWAQTLCNVLRALNHLHYSNPQ